MDPIEKRLIEEGGQEMKDLIDDNNRLLYDRSHGTHLYYTEGKYVLLQSNAFCASELKCNINSPLDEENSVRCHICGHCAHRQCTFRCSGDHSDKYVCKDCARNELKITDENCQTVIDFTSQSVQEVLKNPTDFQRAELKVMSKDAFEKFINLELSVNRKKEDKILHQDDSDNAEESDGGEEDEEEYNNDDDEEYEYGLEDDCDSDDDDDDDDLH